MCQHGRMQILVLGGTKFAGRAIVEAALGRGDAVTLFNRGKTNPGLYPGVETVIGDRTEDLSPLDGRAFDAVIDVACYDPAVARRSAEAFRDRAGRYVFVSSVSVYASQSTTESQLEDAPLAELKPERAGLPRQLRRQQGAVRGRRPRGVRRPRADRPAGADHRAARPDRPLPLLAPPDRGRRPGPRARRRGRPHPGDRRPGPGGVPARRLPPGPGRRVQPHGRPASVRDPARSLPDGDVQRRRADLDPHPAADRGGRRPGRRHSALVRRGRLRGVLRRGLLARRRGRPELPVDHRDDPRHPLLGPGPRRPRDLGPVPRSRKPACCAS